jgi:hypothetical protein
MEKKGGWNESQRQVGIGGKQGRIREKSEKAANEREKKTR